MANNNQTEGNENQFEKNLSNPVDIPLSRSPLNAIPDPSQFPKELNGFGEKGLEAGSSSNRRKLDSAQSTPARSVSRTSYVGQLGAWTGTRVPHSTGERARSSSRVSRRISVVNCEPPPTEVPHFELVEDPSFWNDHNVQVLIRMRPLSNMEKLAQGYGRCLRQESLQTLVWLGHPEIRFTFDHIACETISQEKLFRVAGLPIVDNCMLGYNSCMFAYGQTGSGKTYTMMGEIGQKDGKLVDDCGITPRLFEYLFTRIKLEEENRREERLTYSCKCSFLEIYNEQITDLLEPSSSNLQLREDLQKGVYVENLTEYNVKTVDEVLKLLLQGAANRKVAGTDMNSESSRSHSVFTCIVESRWEKDSLTHLRFGRINLVDLAGSERQTSSAAGERLKEASYINKSLSTLGLVIMSLVDVAHGKHRHVPYRDSRLTFLLQDSLGGNSKTAIIANVSPSVCAANETLSTLKFAQRAKLIQNNAKVNEDASGDVTALQQQIQMLKEQMSLLMKHQKISRPLFQVGPTFLPSSGEFFEGEDSSGEVNISGDSNVLYDQQQETKSLEATLFCDSTREELTGTVSRTPGAQTKKKNQLALQREDVHCTKMMLRFREEKIKRLELLANGKISTDKYLMNENKALMEEIPQLQASIDRNLEVTRFQNCYEQGEREALLTEVSTLHDQLLKTLEVEESYVKHNFSTERENEDDKAAMELDEYKHVNCKLIRKVDELKQELGKYMGNRQTAIYPVETMSIIGLGEEMEAFVKVEGLNNSGHEMGNSLQSSNILKELMNARNLVEDMKALQVSLVEELQYVRQENDRLVETLSNINKSESDKSENGGLESQNLPPVIQGGTTNSMPDLQVKLDKMTKDLDDVRLLNDHQLNNHMLHSSRQDQLDLVREEAEMEATKAILNLQEELAALQVKYHGRLCAMAEENKNLKKIVAAKEDEMYNLHTDWERASLELTSFLSDGSKSLKDASGQIESIACLFPCYNVWIGEHVKKAATVCIEKEQTILQLEKNLVDAQSRILQMQEKLYSLRNATIALTEIQYTEHDASTREAFQLSMALDDKINMVDFQANKFTYKQDKISVVEDDTKPTFLEGKRLYNHPKVFQTDIVQVIAGLASINNKLDTMKACIRSIISSDDSQFIFEDSDGWTTDTSTPSSILSDDEDMAENNFVERCCISSSEATEHTSTLVSEGNSKCSPSNQEAVNPDRDISLSDAGKVHLLLKKQFKMAYDDFIKLEVQLAAVFNEKETDHQSEGGIRSVQSLGCMKTDEKDNSGVGHKQLPKPDTSVPQPSDLVMQGDAAGCFTARKFVAEEKSSKATCFFSKFEEARATVNEANNMLNVLTKANEKAKMLTGRWKQTAEELMMEKTSLIEEITLLKADIPVRDEEHAILEEHSRCSLVELANSVSSIEGCFQHMQRDAEALCHAIYSDALAMAQGIQHCIHKSRSSLEDVYAETMEKGFASFVTHQCYIGEYINHLKLGANYGLCPSRLDEDMMRHVEALRIRQNSSMTNIVRGETEENYSAFAARKEIEELGLGCVDPIDENLKLKKELERKNTLLSGLLFDFSLLQESASTRKDIKDEAEMLSAALSKVQHELAMKTNQLEDMVIGYEKLECRLADTEAALHASESGLERAQETVEALSCQNGELRGLLEDLHLRKAEAEEQLEEQRETVKSLETEIHCTASATHEQFLSSLEVIKDELKMVASERDQLLEHVSSLQDRLEMAYAIADENEAIAVEARQESEASKVYAEQKEEEVKILEHSVEELDGTINVLEKKVNEMENELQRHHVIRDSLELELQALNHRLSVVAKFRDGRDSGDSDDDRFDDQISRKLRNRSLELHKAHARIQDLENERAEQAIEIERCKEYISELVIHAEAQAFQYQQKYKTLEAMINAVKNGSSNYGSEAHFPDKAEKSLVRTRGSSSPFRCIGNLVQQMNTEKDQELSLAKLRIEELDALASSRQKEICMLNTKLAAAESMTHDVIRDLLGVKLDMTNYAHLISQNELQKLIEDAHQQTKEFIATEQEILNLRRQINDLLEERERCISELHSKEAEILSSHMSVAQLQERDQLLTAQNEMLKADKTNLQQRAAELDDMVNKLHGTQPTAQSRSQQPSRPINNELGKRLANSDKLLLRVNHEKRLR